jgi:hypothetical protein
MLEIKYHDNKDNSRMTQDEYYIKFVMKLLVILDKTANINKEIEITSRVNIPSKFLSKEINEDTEINSMIYFGDFLNKTPPSELKQYLTDLKINEEDIENLLIVNCKFLGFCKKPNSKCVNLLLSIKYQ